MFAHWSMIQRPVASPLKMAGLFLTHCRQKASTVKSFTQVPLSQVGSTFSTGFLSRQCPLSLGNEERLSRKPSIPRSQLWVCRHRHTTHHCKGSFPACNSQGQPGSRASTWFPESSMDHGHSQSFLWSPVASPTVRDTRHQNGLQRQHEPWTCTWPHGPQTSLTWPQVAAQTTAVNTALAAYKLIWYPLAVQSTKGKSSKLLYITILMC